MLLVLLCAFLVGLVYLLLKRNLNYWKNHDVPFPAPNLIFGNIFEALIMKKSLGQIYTQMYSDFKDYRYIGFYKAQSPAILLRDPELIKDVFIQHFDSFSSNGLSIDEKVDPLAARNAFIQNGHQWKVTRSQMTRCFTGGKLKTITPLLKETGNRMSTFIENEMGSTGKVNLDAKEIMSKFTIDNVATCAFGVDGDSFVNPDSEFLKKGKKIFEVSTLNALKMMCVFLVPSFASILKIPFVPRDIGLYLLEVVKNTLQFRKQNNIIRKDFLYYMEEIKETPSEFNFQDIDITAQCASFFLDGFETSAITLTFALFLMAKRPDIQDKVIEEIEQVLQKYNGEITYDAIKEMTYLDQVISESQRRFPATMFLSKTCTKDFVFPPPSYSGSGKEITVKEGTTVIIPFYSVQNDEKYYSNPEEFDPERFSAENKFSIDKGTFMGFGLGPRMCLGQAFAILQLKMGLVSIIKNFEIRVNKQTKEPFEFDPKYFMLSVIGGVWLDFQKREK